MIATGSGVIGDRRPPVRVLFVLGCLDGKHAQDQLNLLGKQCDPRQFRLDAVVCFRLNDAVTECRRELEAVSIDVDRTPYDQSFEETVYYLAHKLPAYDVIVSCQNVADIYPSLERLHWRPPLIEFGEVVSDALAGPKHFTSRYVGSSAIVKDVAAARMPGRAHDAVVIPCDKAGPRTAHDIARQWEMLFHAVLAERSPAPPPSLFASFLQGGFECSSHIRRDGRRLDLIAATAHDANADGDFLQLREHGMRTVRDGLRWHLIDRCGAYDWSSFLPMLRAARQTNTQIIWDLMHYGWPDGLDIWCPGFVDRFARFAAAVARVVRSETDEAPFYCPINEISYLAWAGGDAAYLNPFAQNRSFELKAQLVRAAITAMHEILHVEPRSRFVHCEPVIHIVATPQKDGERLDAELARQAQFQAFDMITGALWPQLGGQPRLLDIIGVNFYRQNQWVLGGGEISEQNPQYRPFRALVGETHARYGRPMLVAETGTEGATRAAWFETIASEVKAARRVGIPIEGICLYPVINHVGWDDGRDCPSGLFENRFEGDKRRQHWALSDAIARAFT